MMAFKLLTSLKEIFLEFLFPVKCVVCEKETYGARKNKLICSDCLKELRPNLTFYCPLCEAKSVDAGLCFACLQVKKEAGNILWLDRLYFPFSYKEKNIQKIIKAFKYNFIKDLGEPLSRLMAGYLAKIKDEADFENFLVIPVPLHQRKFYHRGYNQAELIAEKISNFLNLKFIINYLIKNKTTKDQVNLENEDRAENVQGAFACSKSELIRNKNILLIDDVYTTGATMNECARVLKEAGAKGVWGLVIARG